MRAVTRLRERLGDLASPPDEIYRPIGMQRREFNQKIATLTRWEGDIRRGLTLGIGIDMEKMEKRKNGTESDRKKG
jgi:hypothetical protein